MDNMQDIIDSMFITFFLPGFFMAMFVDKICSYIFVNIDDIIYDTEGKNNPMIIIYGLIGTAILIYMRFTYQVGDIIKSILVLTLILALIEMPIEYFLRKLPAEKERKAKKALYIIFISLVIIYFREQIWDMIYNICFR